jgi:hypothetical protein
VAGVVDLLLNAAPDGAQVEVTCVSDFDPPR